MGPVVVSAIGTARNLSDTGDGAATPPERLLRDSLAQGLVRFDAAGQIEPGVAERWIVTDDGRTYVFRLRETSWADGRPLRAADVVTILRRQIARNSRNPLSPYLTAIDSIVEMTPQVIEISLSSPRPNLLALFAQPEMALLRQNPTGGSGPFRIAGRSRRSILLRPRIASDAADAETTAPAPEDDVRLIAERAARAIVRFAGGQSDLVTGGTLEDWPIVGLTSLRPETIRLDPAAGLTGFAITRRTGLLAEAEGRAAIAQAIDRQALGEAFGTGWTPADRILPDMLDSATEPAATAGVEAPLADRRAAARRTVAAWTAESGSIPEIRIRSADGPGGTMLWARIAADLYAIGVRPVRVFDANTADLVFVDAVAPYDSGRWYLATACQPCGEEATTALEAARIAPTLTERAAAIAAADTALTRDVAFIPLARPLRWSLVSARLRNWQANARAWHPLNALRDGAR